MSSASTPLMPRTPPEPVSAADGDNDNVKIVAAAAVESELRSAGLEIFGDASAVGGSAGEDAVNYGSNNIIQQKNTNNHHEDDVPEKDNMLDSLLFAAALASGPHFTRHHYHHTFHPNLSPLSISPALSSRSGTPSLSPTSSVSSGLFGLDIDDEYNAVETPTIARPAVKNDVTVKCMVRTRVPTPHGEVFLHLYHNNRDDKEHLAIVIDPAQLDYDGSKPPAARFIRSKSLDSVWHEDETPMERITRGAYIGRLSEDGYTVSSPNAMEKTSPKYAVPAPLVRIHSECFTGETIGSMRCDCGEQLDEAMRRIAEPITFNDSDTNAIPGRGAVIYMRQEGRGIGLLAKLRAYNLQDLGHDTVQANLLLGRGADERGYDVAAAIVRDLGLDDDEEGGRAGESGIRLLTNNPDKVEKLTDEGVHVLEHVPMVPRTWRCQDESEAVKDSSERMTAEPGSKMDIHDMDAGSDAAARLRSAGATLIGASATRGPELEKYLRTKVLRMGHMLSLPSI